MKRREKDLIWLKKAWLLARCQFKLSESPGFEAHTDELKAFEEEFLEMYKEYEKDGAFDLNHGIPSTAIPDMHRYLNEIEAIMNYLDLVWNERRLRQDVELANHLGMSPVQAAHYEDIRAMIEALRDEVAQAIHPTA